MAFTTDGNIFSLVKEAKLTMHVIVGTEFLNLCMATVLTSDEKQNFQLGDRSRSGCTYIGRISRFVHGMYISLWEVWYKFNQFEIPIVKSE